MMPVGTGTVGQKPIDDAKTQRAQRLAAALRANLHRRKQQARGRALGESDSPGEARDGGSDPADEDPPA